MTDRLKFNWKRDWWCVLFGLAVMGAVTFAHVRIFCGSTHR